MPPTRLTMDKRHFLSYLFYQLLGFYVMGILYKIEKQIKTFGSISTSECFCFPLFSLNTMIFLEHSSEDSGKNCCKASGYKAGDVHLRQQVVLDSLTLFLVFCGYLCNLL